jgi:hypothetical protein
MAKTKVPAKNRTLNAIMNRLPNPVRTLLSDQPQLILALTAKV